MTPPPPANLPLMDRVLKLAQTLQFAWFAGHFTLILCVIRYGLSWIRMNYYTTWAQLSYRLSFTAAAGTYGIVVFKTWRARARTNTRQPGLIGHLADENIQYLLMALVWLFMPQYPLAMVPYAIYSVFHVATYTRTNLLPTIFPLQKATPATGASPAAKPQVVQHPIAEQIGKFVKRYYDSSMTMVSILEITLWTRLFLSAIMFQRRSWIILALYTVFLRARFAQSSHVQETFSQLEARVDNLVGAQGTHPMVRQGWEGAKGGLRQFHQLTDVNQYMNGAAAPKKTT